MPAEPVQVMRALYDALEREGPEAILPFVHRDFEGVVPPELSAEPDAYHGHEGVRRYFALFEEVVEDLRWRAQGFEEVGGWVLADVLMSARGRGSGAGVDMDVVIAARVEDGKVTRMTAFPDKDAARASLA